MIAVLLGTLCAQIDSAVNVAFPAIIHSFGLELQDIRWVPIAYVLTYASLLLIFGRLGDLVGHRIVFQTGLVICTAGFVACSLAPRYELLLLGRVLQGVGVALLLSCAAALATSLYDERERVRILGVLGAMTALGGALGPLVGGYMVDLFGWNAVFWARLPLSVSALLLSFLIPLRPGRGSAAGLDTFGSFQLALALSAILAGVSLRTEMLGLAIQLALVALGALLLAAFIRRQSRLAQPIIRPALFRDPVFSAMNLASALANLAAFTVVLIGPFYFIDVARLDAGTAGLVMAIAAGGQIAGSMLAPRIIGKLGSIATAMLGMGASGAGLVGIAVWSHDTQVLLMLPALVMQGFGIGMFQVGYSDLVTATLPAHERGVAGSLTMLTRSMGIAGGAAALSLLHHGFAATAAVSGANPTEAFMTGFSAVFLIAAGLQLAALLITTLALRRQRASHAR